MWKPSGDGYEFDWADADLGQPAAGFLEFLAVDMKGDGVNQIVQLWTDEKQGGYRVFIPSDKKRGGYEFKDEGTLLQEWPSGPLGFMLVDPRGDGRSSIAQFSASRDDLVSLRVYAPEVTDTKYVYSQSQYSWDFAKYRASTIKWLAVDGGGGKDELVQLTTLEDGNLGLGNTYVAVKGEYVPAQARKDMGLPASASTFLPVRLPGQDREHILHLWNRDQTMGGALYYGKGDGVYDLAWRRDKLAGSMGTHLATLAVDPSQCRFDDCARLSSLADGTLHMELYSPAGYSPGWFGGP